MFQRRVTGNQIQDHPDAVPVGFPEKIPRFGKCSIPGIRPHEICYVIAAVAERGDIPGIDPECVDTETAQIIELRDHTRDIADPVSVRIAKAGRIDLIENRLCKPGWFMGLVHSPSFGSKMIFSPQTGTTPVTDAGSPAHSSNPVW